MREFMSSTASPWVFNTDNLWGYQNSKFKKSLFNLRYHMLYENLCGEEYGKKLNEGIVIWMNN